jgi:hypothetical protein
VIGIATQQALDEIDKRRKRVRPADEPDAPGHVQAARAHMDEMDEKSDNQAADLSKTADGDDVTPMPEEVLDAVHVLRDYLVAHGHDDPLAAIDKARHGLRHPGTGQFVPAPAQSSAHPYLTEGRAADSPANAPATPRPGTSWPDAGPLASAIAAHGVPVHQVGQPTVPAPEPQATLHTVSGGNHLAGPTFEPGTVTLQRVDLASQTMPVVVNAVPGQPPVHAAPTGAVPPQPRGGGNAALTAPGA